MTSDPLPVPTPFNQYQRQGQQGQRNAQPNQNNFKRRHSATDGKFFILLNLNVFKYCYP